MISRGSKRNHDGDLIEDCSNGTGSNGTGSNGTGFSESEIKDLPFTEFPYPEFTEFTDFPNLEVLEPILEPVKLEITTHANRQTLYYSKLLTKSLELQSAINKKINTLDKVARSERIDSQDVVELKEPVTIGENEDLACLLLEIKSERRRQKQDRQGLASNYDPFIISKNNIEKWISLLRNVPKSIDYDLFIMLMTDETKHFSALRVVSEGGIRRVFFMDSASISCMNEYYSDLLAYYLGANIYKISQKSRQYDRYNCFNFALQDLNFMSHKTADELQQIMAAKVLPTHVVRHTQRLADLEPYTSTVTLFKNYVDSFTRIAFLKPDTRVVAANYSITYKSKKYIDLIVNKLQEYKDLDLQVIENRLTAIINQRRSTNKYNEFRMIVNQHFSHELGVDLQTIIDIMSQYPITLDLYQLKLHLTCNIPLRDMFNPIHEVYYKNYLMCPCFGPSPDASSIIYNLCVASENRKETFENIRTLDINQIKLYIKIDNMQHIFTHEQRNDLKDIIKNAQCFFGKDTVSIVNYYSIYGMEDEEGLVYFEECGNIGYIPQFSIHAKTDYIEASCYALEFINFILEEDESYEWKNDMINTVAACNNISQIHAIAELDMGFIKELNTTYHKMLYKYVKHLNNLIPQDDDDESDVVCEFLGQLEGCEHDLFITAEKFEDQLIKLLEKTIREHQSTRNSPGI